MPPLLHSISLLLFMLARLPLSFSLLIRNGAQLVDQPDVFK